MVALANRYLPHNSSSFFGANNRMERMTSKWLLCFAVVGFYNVVRQSKAEDVKVWAVNTNFDNPRNWEGGRLPCANDRVIFSPSSSSVVLMPASLAAAEMVLPVNGELVFPSNAVFNLTGNTAQGSCVGQDAQFKPIVDYWYSPDNWNISSDRAYPRFPSRRNKAVSHAYRVPCTFDSVQFPARTSFSVQGINPAPTITSLRINDLDYNTEDLSKLLASSTGKLLFHDNPTLNIVNSPCSDPSGCICGNQKPPVFSIICAFKFPCAELKCLDPITVTGHCCPICATKIIATTNSDFRMDRFLELHDKLYNEIFNQVDSFTSKISDNEVQIVFVDDTATNSLANKLALLMHTIYNTDVKSVQSYGINSITIQKSERFRNQPSTSDQQSSSNGMSSGGIAGLIIAIIICSGLGAALYIYKKRQIEGFSFARFDLQSDKIELELGTTPHDELEPGDAPSSAAAAKDSGKGFDNPIYGTSVPTEDSSDAEESPEVNDFVENPMFNILEDSSK
ncbi:protein amnionless [Nephila pilipes]|uniref:Protein amnionless n=1 Tax=Nephila pilipes TaxID=299642 RepID=A0A8X6I493_NEPPI|nr:protein amnionless [Nephila pilipes]